tara:strand:- start:512 stop:1486 length:975 start_codon:yes stop_codon:yes gene_type:complete
MNILVTGGAGYIGSNTSHLLIDKGHEVTIVDNLIQGDEKLVPKKANFIKADISDENKIKKILQNKFDLVMHFAGLVKVEESILHPKKYQEYNFEKAKIFLNLCLESDLNKLIFSSSAGVYGQTKEIKKINENDNLNPLNPYAETKYKFERYLLDLVEKKKLQCTILRYFNVAGADEKRRTGLISKGSNNLIKAACEVATKKRKKFIINGDDYGTKDGTPIRDFIHVTDLAEMHFIAAENLLIEQKSEIYNCGYGEGFSVKQVINEIEKILERDLNKEIGSRRAGDIEYSVADVTKFKKKFKWQPKYNNLTLILKSALEWEKVCE